MHGIHNKSVKPWQSVEKTTGYMKCNTRVKHEVYITYPIKHLSCHHGVFHASLDFSLKRRKHNANGYQDNHWIFHYYSSILDSFKKAKAVGVGKTFSSLVKGGKGKTSNYQQTLQRNTTGVLPGTSFFPKKAMLSGLSSSSLLRTQRLLRASATRDHSTWSGTPNSFLS